MVTTRSVFIKKDSSVVSRIQRHYDFNNIWKCHSPQSSLLEQVWMNHSVRSSSPVQSVLQQDIFKANFPNRGAEYEKRKCAQSS